MTAAGGSTPTEELRFDLRGIDQLRLCGPGDAHLRHLERRFGGTLSARGDSLRIAGAPDRVAAMRDLVADLLERVRLGQRIDEVTLDNVNVDGFVAIDNDGGPGGTNTWINNSNLGTFS